MTTNTKHYSFDGDDERNPSFLLQSTHTALLLDIVAGRIDPVELARLELRARGLDPTTGKWAGFAA